jgi:hypothetical protein
MASYLTAISFQPSAKNGMLFTCAGGGDGLGLPGFGFDG